jgi:hypothetical protein
VSHANDSAIVDKRGPVGVECSCGEVGFLHGRHLTQGLHSLGKALYHTELFLIIASLVRRRTNIGQTYGKLKKKIITLKNKLQTGKETLSFRVFTIATKTSSKTGFVNFISIILSFRDTIIYVVDQST